MSEDNGKALVLTGTQVPAINLSEMMTIGKVLASSGFFSDVKGEAQAVAKILAGAEAGFGPMAAMTGIHIVKGKIVMGANLMAAKVKGSGRYSYKVKQLTDTACVLEFFENGKPAGESSFTMDDAKKAGLVHGDNWMHYPRNMLFARAISNGVRWYCADVFNGTTVYTPEEMGDDVAMSGDGEIIVQDVSPPSGNGHKPAVPMITPDQIKAVHATAKTVGLDETGYREELQRRYGVGSSKDLTAAQAQELLNAWKLKPTPARPTPAKTINEAPPLPWDEEPGPAQEAPPAYAQPTKAKLPDPVEPQISGSPYAHNPLCPSDCIPSVWQAFCAVVNEAQVAQIPLYEFEPMSTAHVRWMGGNIKARLETLRAAKEYDAKGATA